MKWKIEFLKLLLSGQTDQAFLLKGGHVPPVLYRYRSFSEHNLKNLATGHEWISLPADFNDVFDGCVTNVKRDIYTALRKSAGDGKFGDPELVVEMLIEAFHIDGVAEVMINQVNKNLRAKDVHICCFSERVDSSVMWAHYGKNHTGYCVSYDFTVPADAKNMFPVYYDFISSSSIDPKLGAEPASDHYPLLFKDKDWGYEREWRLIHYDLLQLNADSQLLKMPPVVAIFAGALCTTEQLAVLRTQAETLDVPLHLMKIDYIKRKLFYEPV
ncbi:DUF2971 domain-containing protein [Mucilaginibacter sp. 44-25]|uniref:DUF2971 domain-containing protein n=1 Tax=Mucilaginibacter sp. 44-25 TaxID=1895794 RepID=UPI00095F89C8|nr:DUF2971 domain-containing protein [Mucilaginibacter sp. 44-25]OJW17292.1 MAG: hypothetical protein BGO48_06975 [Mucilaginibacter sp. 44-25]